MFLAKFWNSEANRKAPEAQSQSAAALESKEIEITAALTFSSGGAGGSLSSAEAPPGYPNKNDGTTERTPRTDYSRIPITRTFKGNRKQFDLSGVRVIEGKIM